MTSRQRLLKMIYAGIPILLLVVSDMAIFFSTGKGIPCVIRLVTGLQCPGCGMTHAAAALLAGEFSKAMEYNLLCLSVVPVLGVYLVYRGIKYIRSGDESFRIWEYILLVVLMAITVIYGIRRNIKY